MPNNNGIITAPIGIGSVQQALGVGLSNIGYLCTSNKVNKWSYKKPFALGRKKANPTDSDIYSINDGFTIPSYNAAPLCFNAVLLGNANWTYNIPSTANDTFRLTDFKGYNASTPSWFTIDYSTAMAEQGTSVYYRLVTLPIDFKTMLTNFNAWKIGTEGVDVGLLLRDINANSDSTSVYYYKIANIADIDTSNEHFISIAIPDSLPVNTTYHVIPCMRSTQQATVEGNGTLTLISFNDKDYNDYTWWAFPISNITLTVSTSGSTLISYLNMLQELISSNFTFDGTYFNIYNVVVGFVNTYSNNITANVSAQILDTKSGTPLAFYQSTIIFAPGTTNIDIVNGDVIHYESELGVGEIQVTLTIANSSKTVTYKLINN